MTFTILFFAITITSFTILRYVFTLLIDVCILTSQTDPYEMNNLYGSDQPHILGYPLPNVISRLDALLFVLKSCQGSTCIKPWNVFHPDGSVQTLHDALDAQYNTFYHAQPKVAFDRCENGYILDAEGPQAQCFDRDGLSWEMWT